MPHSTRLGVALAGALAFISLAVVIAPAHAEQSAAAVPVVHLDGRGHGHGVGMSQWGAFTLAKQGASAAQIIGTFYPGTQLATRGGEVVVGIDRRERVRIQFPGGGEIRSARGGQQQSGFPVSVAPGGTVDVVREGGGYRVVGGSVAALSDSSAVRYSSNQSPSDCVLTVCTPDDEPAPAPPADEPPDQRPPPTTAPPAPDQGGSPQPAPAPAPAPAPTQPPPDQQQPSQPLSTTPVWAVPAGGSVLRSVDRGRSYRGMFEVTGPAGAMRVRNHVDIESYLKGMAEVPGSWPAAAVQAQAIAARTYALRAMSAGGELCDSESCQVYTGISHESAGQAAAVDATRNQVVVFGGRLASTFYSASGGGFAANVAEGFGTPYDVPYLQARPYPTVHPDEWTVDIALADVGRRLGYPGTVTAVRIDQVGPSARPLAMTIDGDAGAVGVDPQDFRRKLGLRSTLFTVTNTEAEQAPPPPPETEDPGVVGAGPDVEESAAAPQARPARSSAADTQAAIGPLDEPVEASFWLGAAALAVLVAAWSAATLGALTIGTGPVGARRILQAGAATMTRWTSRSR